MRANFSVECGRDALWFSRSPNPVLSIQLGMSIETGGIATQSDGGVMFVGRCRDCCGAEDQKIAACGSSYR
ncbi:hypothetical protein EMIT0196MI5_30206 [Pseudomonas sp. IT-196MI5]